MCKFLIQDLKYLRLFFRPGTIEAHKVIKTFHERCETEVSSDTAESHRQFIPELTKTTSSLYDLQNDLKGRKLLTLTNATLESLNTLIITAIGQSS